MNVLPLLDESRVELAARLAAGHALRADDLAGCTYRGTSLGVPHVVERLTWKTFRKVFYQDPARGLLRGWNVRVEQAPPHQAMRRAGAPWTFGHFHVVACRVGESPWSLPEGALLLDYGAGGNARLDPLGRVRDPIVSLTEGSAEVLLGCTYLRVAGRSLPTPSWFVLEREGPVEHVAEPPRGA